MTMPRKPLWDKGFRDFRRGFSDSVRKLAAVCLWLVCAGTAHAVGLAAGPMAGHRDARSVVLWLQADAKAQAQIEYWAVERADQRRRSNPVMLAQSEDFAGHITLDGLAPGTAYRYRVLLDGRPVALPQELQFRTEALWQWQKHSFIAAQGHTPADFKVAFGACSYLNDPPFDRSLAPTGKPYGGNYEIFSSIAAQKPDVMLWLGDNTYLRESDYGSASGIAARFKRDRALPELQPLLRTGHHYAIWDDHDFGPNDSNSSFVYKGETLKMFQRYWANGVYGTPEIPGIFRVVSLNDADVFLLDNRFHRDSDKLQSPGKTMFGAGQLRWLKNALLASTANFKIIVNGNQMLKSVPPQFEGWSNFREERAEFLDWLSAHRVNGVLFLSGDRHHTVLTRLERQGAYPLLDLTCSPLTSGPHAPIKAEDMSHTDADTLVTQRNFCTLDFSGPWGNRRLTMKSHDPSGRELWQREINSRDLTHPR